LIPSDVTVDYNAPLPYVLVPFHRIRTLSQLGAGGDGELLDLQLSTLASERHTHSPLAYLRHSETYKGDKHS